MTYLKHFPSAAAKSFPPSASTRSCVLVTVHFQFFWALLNSLPRSLPPSISFTAPSHVLLLRANNYLPCFRCSGLKINLNKRRDLSRYRNVIRVMEEQMKKTNKRYTKRMSPPLSRTDICLARAHRNTHRRVCPCFSETEPCFKEILSLKAVRKCVFQWITKENIQSCQT